MNPGTAYALMAYIAWGLFPLYFRAMRSVPSLDVLLHRMVWAAVAIVALLAILGRWSWVGRFVRSPREVLRFIACATLVSANWFVYIWATQHDHVVDASLGYFMTPLIVVMLGRVVLHERLRPAQWSSLAIAAIGVGWLAVLAGNPPWIGLALALSFGTYGLLKKTAPLGALEGLAVETLLMLPFALIGLTWMQAHGHDAWLEADATLRAMLLVSGPLTALPLILFAAGARRIAMTRLGLLQYVAPTLQLALGVVVFDERIGPASLVGYGLVWIGVAIYAGESLWRHARSRSVEAERPA